MDTSFYKPIRCYDENTSGVDYVVGDIHGNFKLLEQQLSEIGFDKSADRLFCVGDLIDRHEDSKDVIYYLMQPWLHSVRGNHEEMMLDYWEHQSSHYQLHWYDNGGDWSKGIDIWPYVKGIQNLPFMIVVNDKYAIMHADMYDGIDRDWLEDYMEEPDSMVLWGRRTLSKYKQYENTSIFRIDGFDKVFFGHSPIGTTPVTVENRVYMDSGQCFYPERKFIILRLE